jgi:hypothetical protein
MDSVLAIVINVILSSSYYKDPTQRILVKQNAIRPSPYFNPTCNP